jgi:beta-glucosidase
VTNTGKKAGTETPQVYLTLPSATGEPGSRLVGFSNVTLKAGESKKVSVTIDRSSADKPLSYWDSTAHAWATAPGTYGVTVGGSSQGTLTASFTVAP